MTNIKIKIDPKNRPIITKLKYIILIFQIFCNLFLSVLCLINVSKIHPSNIPQLSTPTSNILPVLPGIKVDESHLLLKIKHNI